MQKKNNKTSLVEAVASAMSKGVVDMSGKSDMDMTGRGSQIPSPVNTSGAAVTQVSMSNQGAPVTMRTAPGTFSTAAYQDASHENEENVATATDEEEEDNKEEGDDDVTEVSEEFRNAISNILGENVSQSLLNQLEAIFEAAVKDRVEKNLTNILVELDEGVKTHLDTVTETLVEKVDDYLDYVVEEWMTENAVAVEQGIKTQIAENFIGGLKNLFENHYIDVPAEKYNVLDELYAQNRELETKLNNSMNENMNLRKEVSLTECAGIFVAETRDLADTQVFKLQNLMENVKFATSDEYREKLVAIKDNYMSGSKPTPTRVVDAVDSFAKPMNIPGTLVEGYASALGRMNRKV